jgi:hypothetical protein
VACVGAGGPAAHGGARASSPGELAGPAAVAARRQAVAAQAAGGAGARPARSAAARRGCGRAEAGQADRARLRRWARERLQQAAGVGPSASAAQEVAQAGEEARGMQDACERRRCETRAKASSPE